MDADTNPLSLPPHELERLRREAREALQGASVHENSPPSPEKSPIPPGTSPRNIIPPLIVPTEEFEARRSEAKTVLSQKNSPPPPNFPLVMSEAPIEKPPNLPLTEGGRQAAGETLRDTKVHALEEKVRARARSEREKAAGEPRVKDLPAVPEPLGYVPPPRPPERGAIKTMRSDVAHAVETQKLSLSQIALLERQKRVNEATEIELRERGQSQKIVISASIIFVLAATGVISYLAFFGTTPPVDTTLPGKVSRESIVHADLERALDIAGISGLDVRTKMREIVLDTTVNPGKVTNVLLTNARESTQTELRGADFASALSLTAPAGFSKSLDAPFMFGVYSSGSANHGFLIFKSRSYETTFDALLSWESRMAEDLLVPLGATMARSADGTWQDAVIKTISSRALISQGSRINLVYAFLDKRTLLITTDKDTFVEVMGRYTTPKNVIR